MKLAERKSRQKQYDDDSEEDNGGICSHCQKSFDSFSQFIRHVTHSKACKDGYNKDSPGLLEKYKRTARLKSRRKAYHTMVNGPNGEAYREHREDRRKRNNKVYHISARVKLSECGRAFEQTFKLAYQKAVGKAKIAIEQQVKDQDTRDEALDFAFMEWPKTHFEFTDEDFRKTELDILEETFRLMEDRYNYMRNKLNEKHKEKWKEDKNYSITYGLLPITLDKAFLTCYAQHFTSIFDVAIDRTFEIVLDTLVFTEDYFDDDRDLSMQLEKAFETVFQDEITKMANDNHLLQVAITNIIGTELKKRFHNEKLEYFETE